MSRFVYLREFTTVDGVDFSSLTLQQRLFMSAVLSKYRYAENEKKTLAELIFNYEERWTKVNFKAYDELITSIIENELGEMTVFIKKNAKRLDENTKSTSAEERYYIKGIVINTNKAFVTRNGAHGDSLPQIAWKYAALASSLSKIGYPQWRMLPIYNWVADVINYNEILKKNKTILKRSIEKWLRAVEISGEFEGNTFIVDPKHKQIKFDDNTKTPIRGASKPAKEKK